MYTKNGYILEKYIQGAERMAIEKSTVEVQKVYLNLIIISQPRYTDLKIQRNIGQCVHLTGNCRIYKLNILYSMH